MNERTITFRLGEENGIVIQKDSFENSLFLNQYQQAIDIFDHLWKEQIEWDKSSSNFHYLDNQFSNVIAFCGDRGEGKTSCMSSFATILTDEKVRKNACRKKNEDDEEKKKNPITISTDFLQPQQIEWLGTIDPSFFDTKHNLLELLLGRMYAKVVDEMKNNSSNNECDKQYNRRLLMEQFERVKSDISKLEKNDKIYDSLEEISDLAAGVNLKKDLQELFTRYLNYTSKKCLLICIDDLDLNISEGYEMAEMLRKYLVCPQCIILVAVKVEQLIDVIATAHKKKVGNAEIAWEQCLNMARRYVAKLLPRRNRISMPIPIDFCEYDLNFADIANNIIPNESNFTVKEKIVQMIFQKTGYVFYNTQHISPIIPKNLRSLRHLLSMLFSVPDAKDAKGKENEIGRDSFKEYFFGTWVAQKLKNDQMFAQQLSQYDNLVTMNAFVVEYFSKRIKNSGIEITVQSNNMISDDSEIYTGDYAQLYLNITNKANTSTNISVGDVMYILWLVNTITVDEDIQNLIFFIKTVYSMRLFACYDQITAKQDKSLFPEADSMQSQIMIYKADRMYDNVNILQRLVNGSYFSYPTGSLLSNKSDRFVIDFTKVRSLFDDLRNCLKKGIETNKEDFVRLLNLCEYLALTITYASTKENIEKKNFSRTAKTPTFIGVHSHTANEAIFDFLHPFYALTNIKYAYRRFDEILSDKSDEDYNMPEQNILYNIAQNEEKSILSQLKYIRKEIYQDGWDMHGSISDAIIRVIDIQWAIYEELLRQYRAHRVGSIVEKIRHAYKDIQALDIKLYQKFTIEEHKFVLTKEAYAIKFEFLKSICDLLGNKKFASDLNEILISMDSTNLIKMDIVFLNSLNDKLRRLRKWPRKGNSIRETILVASKLEGVQRTLLELHIKDIFHSAKDYSYDEVKQMQSKIVTLYIEATTYNGH